MEVLVRQFCLACQKERLERMIQKEGEAPCSTCKGTGQEMVWIDINELLRRIINFE